MDPLDAESFQLLLQARQRARKLVDGIAKQQADVLANPPKLDPQKLEEGKYAMAKALAAAQRSLAALEDAIKMASVPTN